MECKLEDVVHMAVFYDVHELRCKPLLAGFDTLCLLAADSKRVWGWNQCKSLFQSYLDRLCFLFPC